MADGIYNVPRKAGIMDLAAGIQTGMNMGSGLIENMARAQQYQRAALANQEAMKQQQAMQAFTQAGGGQAGIDAAMKISPMTGMGLDDRQMAKTGNAVALWDKMKGNAYGNLEYYNKEMRPAFIKMGMNPSMLPEFDNEQKLNDFLFQNEKKAAEFKQMAKMRGDVWRNMGGGKMYNQVTGETKTVPGFVQHIGANTATVQTPEGVKILQAPQQEKPPAGEERFANAFIADYKKANPKATTEEAYQAYFRAKQTGKVKTKGAGEVGESPLGPMPGAGGKFKLPLKGGGFEDVDEDTYNAYVKQYGKP